MFGRIGKYIDLLDIVSEEFIKGKKKVREAVIFKFLFNVTILRIDMLTPERSKHARLPPKGRSDFRKPAKKK